MLYVHKSYTWLEDASAKLEAGEAITSGLEAKTRTRQMLFRRRAILSCKEVINMHEVVHCTYMYEHEPVVQSVRTSERLRECVRQSSLLLPLQSPL